MTKTIYLTLGASVIASLLLLGNQQQKNSVLKTKAEQLSTTFTQTLDTSQSSQPESKEPLPETITDTAIRPLIIAHAEKQLKEIVKSSANMSQDITAAVKNIPLILEVVSHLHAEELLDLFNRLSSTTTQAPNNKFPSLILGALLAEADPLRVLNAADTNNLILQKIKSNALNSLMLRDPEAGMQWYTSNQSKLDSLTKKRVNSIVSLNLMRSTPHECIEFLSELPASELRSSIQWLDSFRMNTTQRGQLISTLRTQKNPQLNESIAQSLYRSALATKDKQVFTETMEGISLPPKQRHPTLIEAVDHVLAHSGRDHQKVVDFIHETSSDEDRPAVMKGVMQSWAYRDTKAAGEWLQELEPSPTKDSTMAGYAQAVVKADPEAAMEWLEQISNPAKRKQATQDVMKAWSKNDPAAAQKWQEAQDKDSE